MTSLQENIEHSLVVAVVSNFKIGLIHLRSSIKQGFM